MVPIGECVLRCSSCFPSNADRSERLIWSVMAETMTGDTVESDVEDFINVIVKNLTKNGPLGRS